MLSANLNRDTDRTRLPGEAATGDAPCASTWAAPTAAQIFGGAGRAAATVTLPGSKSLTARQLVLATLAAGPGMLRQPLHSRDTQLMVAACQALGATISQLPQQPHDSGDLKIIPPAQLSGSTSIACGLAGTVMRFVPPLAALALGPTSFDGDPYARKRPMQPLLQALRDLGADIADEGRGKLPFTVHGSGALNGGKISLDASLSSQFVSALLLAAPRFTRGIDITHCGERLPSLPHIEMTLAALRERGVNAFSAAPGRWVVEPGPIAASDCRIEADLSNAAPFLAAAIATGGTITVPHWPHTTTQVGDHLRQLLPHFGASLTRSAAGELTITQQSELRGVQLDVPNAGELAPTLVALAALAAQPRADGTPGQPSTITGIGHIRHHETDRIAALVHEINALGGAARELADGIAILPAKLHGGLWRSYADHRMATSGALIGLCVPGVEIDDIACTSKTLPKFAELWCAMGGRATLPASGGL